MSGEAVLSGILGYYLKGGSTSLSWF